MGPCPSRGEKVGEGPDHLAVDAVRSDDRRVKRHLIQKVNTVKDVMI